MKRALVLANGEWNGDATYFQQICQTVDTIVCADGGAKYAMELGLKPDRIFGDLDSIEAEVRVGYERMGIEFVLFPAEKDKTDTHLVIDYLIAEGYQEIFLGGALGGRPDHLLGNMMLLSYAHQHGVRAKLISPMVEILVISGVLVIEGHAGDTFSLIPIDPQAKGVTLTGFKYPLTNATVLRESTLGVSNLIEQDYARVEVAEGAGFIFITHSQSV